MMDTSEAESMGKAMSAGLKGVNLALHAMGLSNERTANAVKTTVSMMQLGMEAVKLIGIIRTTVAKRKTEETVKAAALTAASSTNPLGWGRIAIAAAAAAAATIGVAMAVNKINMGSYDLSDPMGRHDAVNAVNGVIA